jgi:hypothetical protein
MKVRSLDIDIIGAGGTMMPVYYFNRWLQRVLRPRENRQAGFFFSSL